MTESMATPLHLQKEDKPNERVQRIAEKSGSR